MSAEYLDGTPSPSGRSTARLQPTDALSALSWRRAIMEGTSHERIRTILIAAVPVPCQCSWMNSPTDGTPQLLIMNSM